MKILTGLVLSFLLFGLAGISQAELVKIGQGIHWDGTSGMTTSNLIWDKDFEIVWLDYTAPIKNWENQKLWVQGINTMVVTLDSGYSVDWEIGNLWRLPDAHNRDGSRPEELYNVTDSEMGHLFLVELGITTYLDRYYDVTDVMLNAFPALITACSFINIGIDFIVPILFFC